MDIIKEEKLVENAAKVGEFLLSELKKMQGTKGIKEVRGLGLMIGIEFEESAKEIRRQLLFDEKVFTGASGEKVIRLLPPLCLSIEDAKLFLERFSSVLNKA